MNKLTFAAHKEQLAKIYKLAITRLTFGDNSPEDDTTFGHQYACHAIRYAVVQLRNEAGHDKLTYEYHNLLVGLAVDTFAEYFKPKGVKKDDNWFGDAYGGCVENYRHRLLALMFMVEICK